MPPRADVRTPLARSFSSAADACRSAALAGLGGLDELDSAVAVVVCAAASLGGWTGERAAAALTRRVVRRTPDPLAPLFLLDDAELQVDGVRRAALVVLAVPGLAAARARRGGAAVRHGPLLRRAAAGAPANSWSALARSAAPQTLLCTGRAAGGLELAVIGGRGGLRPGAAYVSSPRVGYACCRGGPFGF